MGGRWWVAWVSRLEGSQKGGFLSGSYPESEAREMAKLRNKLNAKEHAWALQRPEYEVVKRGKHKEEF